MRDNVERDNVEHDNAVRDIEKIPAERYPALVPVLVLYSGYCVGQTISHHDAVGVNTVSSRGEHRN